MTGTREVLAQTISVQRDVTFTSFRSRASTRFIIEPPSAQSPGPFHFTAVVTDQPPSETRGKEKLPETLRVVQRRVKT